MTLLEQLQQEAREKLPCPTYGCDNQGTITVADENGDPTPEQCEFCWRRDSLVKHVLEEGTKAMVVEEFIPPIEFKTDYTTKAWNAARTEQLHRRAQILGLPMNSDKE